MLEKSKALADGRDYPQWSADAVAEVLGPLIGEYDKLRAALTEALDSWEEAEKNLHYDRGSGSFVEDNSSLVARIAELRKLVKS